MISTLNLDYFICINIKIFSLFLCVIMKDKKLEHIHNVIQPWDVNQFIRTCYLNLNWDEWMVTNKMFDEYIERIREQAFKNWYAEEDLQKIIADWKEIAKSLDGLTMNFN